MTPERAAELARIAAGQCVVSKTTPYYEIIQEAILAACNEQREQDAKIAEGYELPGKLVAKAIRSAP